MKKTLFLLIFMCCRLNAIQAGVVAYWTFDENAPGTATSAGDVMLDVSGNGLNLVIADTGDSNPIYTASDPRYNPLGAAISLDRNYDQRLILDAGAVNIDPNCTIEALVYMQGVFTEEYGLMQKSGTNGQWWMRFDKNNGRTNFLANNYPSPDSAFKVGSGDAAGVNQWVHIAVVRDGIAGEWRVYHNYNLVLTSVDAAAGASLDNNGALIPFQIGTIDSSNSAKRFNGAIDFIRISNTALEPADFVQPMGNASSPDPIHEARLVPLNQVFSWIPISDSYTVISQTVTLSDSPDMNNVLEAISPVGNSATFSTLEKGKTYYWAVDTLLDFGDVGTWIQSGEVWVFQTPGCVFGLEEGDLNGDCIVNFDDFAIMASNWLRADEFE